MFGAQSSRRREADFTRGKPIHYILVGMLVTLVFILTVWGVVKLVVGLAGVRSLSDLGLIYGADGRAADSSRFLVA